MQINTSKDKCKNVITFDKIMASNLPQLSVLSFHYVINKNYELDPPFL